MSYFNYQSHKIYYKEMGEGTPLLMLHGNTASSSMFSEIAKKYAEQYKVVLIDFLGCGKSDRVQIWNEDLWYDEAMQVITFLEEKKYQNVNLIGTSGGALAAINVALERPDLVSKLIADSFEGEYANPAITNTLRASREASKQDKGARMFYEVMNGADWESVINSDTQAIVSHAEHVVNFFHKSLSLLKAEVLFTGSEEDLFFPKGHYKTLFDEMLLKMGHGSQHIFAHGGHPAILSNEEEFIALSQSFFNKSDKLR